MTTWEQLLIHGTRHQPARCRTEGLSVNLFASPDCRKIFTGISDIFEDTGAEEPIFSTCITFVRLDETGRKIPID